MATEIRLSDRHPASVEGVHAAMEALYNWNYDSEIDQLRTLYANALERQWIAMRDLDWDAPFDREAFSRSVSLGGFPIQQTEFWRSLPEATRWEISRRSAAWMLSNFLHGEQGALMVASQLVAAVPHMDGKFYAATQTLDEARHVEVFAAYVRKIDDVQPISPGLKRLLDNVLATESWLEKAVGMQVVTEGLALYSFRDMRNAAEEPLLRKLLTYVSRDEARHTGYGVKYLSDVVPTPQRRRARRARGLRLRVGAAADRLARRHDAARERARHLARRRHRRRRRAAAPDPGARRHAQGAAAHGRPLRPGARLRDPDAALDRPVQPAHPEATSRRSSPPTSAPRWATSRRTPSTCPTTSRPGSTRARKRGRS